MSPLHFHQPLDNFLQNGILLFFSLFFIVLNFLHKPHVEYTRLLQDLKNDNIIID